MSERVRLGIQCAACRRPSSRTNTGLLRSILPNLTANTTIVGPRRRRLLGRGRGPGAGFAFLPSFVPVQSGNADAGPEVGIKGGAGVGENPNTRSSVGQSGVAK